MDDLNGGVIDEEGRYGFGGVMREGSDGEEESAVVWEGGWVAVFVWGWWGGFLGGDCALPVVGCGFGEVRVEGHGWGL